MRIILSVAEENHPFRRGEGRLQVASSLTGWHGTQVRRFVRHVLEMVVAMMLGMVVLGRRFAGCMDCSSVAASTLRFSSTLR